MKEQLKIDCLYFLEQYSTIFSMYYSIFNPVNASTLRIRFNRVRVYEVGIFILRQL